MIREVREGETEKLQYFLNADKIFKRFLPFIDDGVRAPWKDEFIIEILSCEFNEEQLEMIVYLLEKEIKVKEFNRTYSIATLAAIFALASIIFPILSDDLKGTLIALIIVIGLAFIIIGIWFNYGKSEKSYRNINKLLILVSVAKKYKSRLR
ncbi:hypothetical protein [Sporosarcina psychrophila]|uniref:DUF4231 domain-containing protein n=1 Tax=Sporosarcina psychrophila TaxID=1476 RepID=A0ABV2KBA7_SPOPS